MNWSPISAQSFSTGLLGPVVSDSARRAWVLAGVALHIAGDLPCSVNKTITLPRM
jgi:hypothetical protein